MKSIRIGSGAGYAGDRLEPSLELIEKGQDADMEKIKEDIRTRDTQDMNRSIAPLKQAKDAVVIDSSKLTIPEVMDRIVDAFQESLKLKG